MLSRSLNILIFMDGFTSFSMKHNRHVINYLAFVDDIMIFSGGNSRSIKLIKKTIRRYEKALGQKANDDKSFFISAPNTFTTGSAKSDKPLASWIKMFLSIILDVLSIREGKESVCSMACYPKYQKAHCRGKLILIKHVLQSLSIYTLSALNPLKAPSISSKSTSLIFLGLFWW